MSMSPMSKAKGQGVRIMAQKQGTCFLCDSTNCRRRMRLSGFIKHGNVQIGTVLRMMGEDVGYKMSWNRRFICERYCWTLVNRWFTVQRNLESISLEWNERTGKRLQTLDIHKGQKFKRRAVNLLQRSDYAGLIRVLMEYSTGFKQVWLNELVKLIRKEMNKLCAIKDLFPTSYKEGLNFAWESVLQRVKSTAPTVFTVINATLVKDKKSRSMSTLEKSRLGTMVLIPVHHRHPWMHRFIPSVLSTSLWKSGTKGKLIDTMCRMGIGQSVKTARKRANRLAAENNKVLQTWCETIQNECNEDGTSTSETPLYPSYAIVLDNAQRLSRTDNAEKDKNEMQVVCSGYAVKNKVSFRYLTDSTQKPAFMIPISNILPSQRDYDSLKARMTVIVERILTSNLRCFEDVADTVQEHIPHKYSKEAAQKSECVNLDTIEENPSSTDGMIKILTDLSKKVPENHKIPLYGDQETVDVAASSQITCSTRDTPEGRLSEFQPVPKDFQLRSLVMKDTINDLYTPTRSNECGTLRQLQSLFSHPSVNESMSNFKQTDDFLLFVCCLLVVGMAIERLNMTSCDDELPGESDDKALILTSISKHIVSSIWNQTSMNCIANIVNSPVAGYNDRFCTCKRVRQPDGEDMIECGNMHCKRGRWFHRKCVNISEEDEEEDWFCSTMCTRSGQTAYCVCRTKRQEPLSLTCANEACPRGEKFHQECVLSQALGIINGKWYCSYQCLDHSESACDVSESVDHLLLYVETCARRCLLNEALRDAVCEGDGLAMMSHWRILFPELFLKEHTGYVALTHRLLTGISGCFPKRIQQEVIHNRTINVKGGAGNNVGFGQENCNKNVKGSARPKKKGISRSNKPSTTISPMEQDVVDVITYRIGGFHGDVKRQRKPTPRYQRYNADVRSYLNRTEPNSIFRYEAGRVIPSVMDFHPVTDLTPDQAEQMKSQIIALNMNRDIELELTTPQEL